MGPIRAAAEAGADLEEVLDAYQAEAADDQLRQTQLASVICYIRDVVSESASGTYGRAAGVTSYVSLVDHLRVWSRRSGEEVTYITFNYDELLDWAWKDVYGQKVTDIHSLILRPGGAPQVFHPHGSTSWARPLLNLDHLGGTLGTEDILQNFYRLGLGEPVLTAHHPGLLSVKDATTFFPALSLPLKTKSTFVFPQPHREEMSRCLSTTSRVLVVGWRASEPHFLSLWADQKPPAVRALIVSNSEDGCSEAISCQWPSCSPRWWPAEVPAPRVMLSAPSR